MTGIATIWHRDTQTGDFAISGTRLATGGDLATNILNSLFTWRQAEPDDVIPDGTTDPRGWWGDLDQTYKIGSRLWLLSRAKKTQDVLQRAKGYAVEALQWLIDDGVVEKFDIETEFVGTQLRIGVTAWRGDAQKFSWVWGAAFLPTSGTFQT